MHMKTLTTVRKPIYLIAIVADGKDFTLTYEVVKLFKEKHPEYADCEYDSTFNNGQWTIRFYRECAVDFVEQ